MKWSGYALAGMLLLSAAESSQAQCQGGNRSMGGQMTTSAGGQMTSSAGTQMAAMQSMQQAMCQQQATQQSAVAQQQAMIRQQMINEELKRQAMKAQLARLGASPARAARMAALREKLASYRNSPRGNRTAQWVATAR